jgi:hypothetical protein
VVCYTTSHVFPAHLPHGRAVFLHIRGARRSSHRRDSLTRKGSLLSILHDGRRKISLVRLG